MAALGVLEQVGGTPLVRLDRLVPAARFELYGKLEGCSTGGSIKDRSAFAILEGALSRGEVAPGGTVVESSSGNMGIGLALACRLHRLRFVCVVDPRTTPTNRAILAAYGAEVVVVDEPDPASGDFLRARLDRVEQLVASTPGAYWPNQYANLDNPRAHHTTAREIVEALDGRLDYLLIAASTCGTLRGCAEYLAGRGLPTRVVAVDAVGSVLFGGERGDRLIPGHGAAVPSPLLDPGLVHRAVQVDDLACVVGCRRLVGREGILAGGSSGAVVSALDEIAGELPAGARVALIFPDRGERYLDSIYDDRWVEERFGDVAHLWSDELPEDVPQPRTATAGR